MENDGVNRGIFFHIIKIFGCLICILIWVLYQNEIFNDNFVKLFEVLIAERCIEQGG